MCMEQLEDREHNKSQINRSTIASGNRSTVVSAEQQKELQQAKEENRVLQEQYWALEQRFIDLNNQRKEEVKNEVSALLALEL